MPSKPTYVTKKEFEASEPIGQAVVRASKAKASNRRFNNVEPGVTVRDGASYDNWDYFRPEQAPPVDPKEKMAACLQACDRFGVVGNTIDMMSEFACQGIDLCHPDPATERFYKRWWQIVRGSHVTERMLNLFYSAGTVPVKRTSGTLSASDADTLKKAKAEYDDVGDVKFDLKKKGTARRIPARYTILNPLSLEVIGASDIAPLIGQVALQYGVRVNKVLIDQLTGVRKKDLYAALHNEIDELLESMKGGEIVPVPAEDLKVIHYKKHDWKLWATPMLFRLYRDLQTLDQLKLADMAALDGAASHVRLWKVGSRKDEIYASQAATDRLAELLAARAPGEVLDIIWDDAIDLVETKADIHNFLGEDKYRPVWAEIFGGLGVPLSLTGVPGANSAGATNNWTSLKTLVERLEYGRRCASEFWEEELRIVQKAMGFRKPATLVFDRQSLSDETEILRLLIELMDRNVISREAVQERFSLIPEIEATRTRREWKRSKKGQIPPKGGPWDDPTFEQKVLLALMQQQRITPRQAGVDLYEDDELPEGQEDRASDPTVVPPDEDPKNLLPKGPKGEPGKGRPPGKKDQKKRKSPKFSPRKAAVVKILAAAFAAEEDAYELAEKAADRVLARLPGRECTAAEVIMVLHGVYQETSSN